MTPAARLEAALQQHLRDMPPRIGLAVSGGGDSMALMVLTSRWAAAQADPPQLHAITIDHGLRPEAADEAAQVARAAAALGIVHQARRWDGWDGRGNLQAAARAARQRLIAGWAAEAGLGAVLLGHTRDDQAETLLLRLARGSGLEGLSGMAPARREAGLLWLRPLLEATRAELREVLRAAGVAWCEDPSNADTRFDRVRARQLLEGLAPLGLDSRRLARSAAHLQEGRALLRRLDRLEAARAVRQEAGDLLFLAAIWAEWPPALRRRLLAAALQFVGGSPYRPRLDALEGALADVAQGRAATLAGCLLRPERAGLRICREAAAAAGPAPAGATWDGRWQVRRADGAAPGEGLAIAALGEAGLAQLPAPPPGTRPRAARLADPALWQGERLVAAPTAGWPQGHHAALVPGRDSFAHWLDAH